MAERPGSETLVDAIALCWPIDRTRSESTVCGLISDVDCAVGVLLLVSAWLGGREDGTPQPSGSASQLHCISR